MKIEDIQKISQELEPSNGSGISEIKVIMSEHIKEGNPVLLLSPADFHKYFPEKKQPEEYRSLLLGHLKPL